MTGLPLTSLTEDDFKATFQTSKRCLSLIQTASSKLLASENHDHSFVPPLRFHVARSR